MESLGEKNLELTIYLVNLKRLLEKQVREVKRPMASGDYLM